MGILKRMYLEQTLAPKYIYDCELCGDIQPCDSKEEYDFYKDWQGHCDYCEHVLDKMEDE
jgi:hypothetical protein